MGVAAFIMLLIAPLALAGTAAPSLAQAATPASHPLEVTAVDTDDYPAVVATLTAPPSLVGPQIPASAFTVTEDGQRRAAEVTRLPSDDLQVVLLIDTSGSMRGAPMDAAKAAAVDFVEQMPHGVEVSVVGFGSAPVVAHAFSEDASALSAAIGGLQARGETALYDAVAAAAGQWTAAEGSRRVVVLLSDGGDTASALPLADAASRLTASAATLTVVQLQTPETDGIALEELAAAGAGRVLAVDDAAGLADAYAGIAAELVNRYEVRFASRGHGSTELRVAIDHGDVQAQTATVMQLPSAPAPAPAQPAPTVGSGASTTLRVVSVDSGSYPEVAVRVIAPRTLAARDLTADAFVITENGRDRQLAVSSVEGVDLEVALVVDTSGSMQGTALEAAKAAAMDFINKLPAGTRVALVSFADAPTLVTDFTGDGDVLRTGVAGLSAGGNTALYDGVDAAARLFSPERAAVRSLVILSDGGDTHSTATVDAVAARLARLDIAAHAVQIPTTEMDAAILGALVGPAGGDVVAADDAAALRSVYDGIAADVGNQYILRYRSDSHGQAEIAVAVQAGQVSADTVHTVELPPESRWEAVIGSRLGLVVGASLSYLAMALAIIVLVAPRRRLGQLAGSHTAFRDRSSSGLANLAGRASDLAEQGLHRRGRRAALNNALERAGINLRPGEFLVLCICSAVIAGVVGMLLAGAPAAMALAGMAMGACRVVPQILAQRRCEKFGSQLTDTLQLLAGALRAGYGLLQAIDAVASEAESPTSDEFRRLVVETRLGRDLDGSMRAMAKRTGSKDFEWVVQAVEIHREVGGDLADVLDTVAGTIREREQIRRQIAALSAEGKLSAVILLGLPFVVAGFIYMVNPPYMSVLFETRAGLIALGTGAVLMTMGSLWMRKLVQLRY